MNSVECQPLLNHKKDPWPPKSPASRLLTTASTMARTRPFLTIILLILVLETSSGHAEIAKDGTASTGPPCPAYLLSKMQTRKALVEIILDYDYGGHNNKHEHMRGKPGTGGKNP